jgi:hypothetical protein
MVQPLYAVKGNQMIKNLIGCFYKGKKIIEDDGFFIRVEDGTVYARLKNGGFA